MFALIAAIHQLASSHTVSSDTVMIDEKVIDANRAASNMPQASHLRATLLLRSRLVTIEALLAGHFDSYA